MQTIDPIKPYKKRSDIGPAPRPRAGNGGSIDGMVGGRSMRQASPLPKATPGQALKPHQPSQVGSAIRAPQPSAVPPQPRSGSVRFQPTAPPQVSRSQTPAVAEKQKKSKKIKQKRIWPTWLKGILFGLMVLCLAALGIFPEVGQVVILVGVAIAIIRRVESRLIFALALATLVLIPISQVLSASYLANSYAIFAYLLLFGGTVGLAFELLVKRKQKLSTTYIKKT